jgi:exodeoxyribonuclease V beta subunit
MTPLDLLACPLVGRHLVEASAGTGKTWTLAHLYLRLVLERPLPVERILVVTFTEAATAELRGRIHDLVSTALAHLDDQASLADPTLAAIIAACEPGDCRRLLQRALYTFDDAGIFTIHGFCQRLLAENAFETGTPFGGKLVPEQQQYLIEAAEDFWRRRVADLPVLFAGYLIDAKVTLDSLIRSLGRQAARPAVEVTPQETRWPDTGDLEHAFADGYAGVQAAWEAFGSQVEQLLLGSDALNRNVYRLASMPQLIERTRRFVAAPPLSPRLFEKFENLTAKKMTASIKKGHPQPTVQPFLEACQALADTCAALCDAYDIRRNALSYQFFVTVREELARKKASDNVRSFDDLLTAVEAALAGPEGGRLGAAIRRRYRAALIDEFQDTDRIQYAIFGKAFEDVESTLYLIGDPKQAIYAFRGADVFTYMQAKEQVPESRRHTLLQNHRSSKGLVAAVNAVFTHAANPFIFSRIPFERAQAADQAERETLTVDGKEPTPLTLWFVPGQIDDKGRDAAVKVEDASTVTCDAVARQSATLIASGRVGRACIGKRGLAASDIAVLCRTNLQAEAVRQALAGRGVRSVLYSLGSIFDTPDVVDYQRILAAVITPADDRLARAALCTPAFGWTGDRLVQASAEDLAQALDGFAECHRTWLAAGFVAMARRLMDRYQVRRNLLVLPEGERRLTNFMHLTEILQAAATSSGMAMHELLTWLTRQRNNPLAREQEQELRLDSDDDAVRILTIHRSKGMQFPVVFAPFLYAGSGLGGSEVIFHEGDRLVYDFGSADIDSHKATAEQELLAENVRLAYVALTRASHLCYTAWGRINAAETSALAWLLHGHGLQAEPERLVEALRSQVRKLDTPQVRSVLANLAEASKGAVAVVDVNDIPEPGPSRAAALLSELGCRTFGRHLDEQWRVTSFTALAHGSPAAAETPDRDEFAPAPAAPVEQGTRSIFAFPRGAAAGTLLHAILEQTDFTQATKQSTTKLVSQQLVAAGFDADWQPVVCQTIERLCAAKLTGAGRLADIPCGQRLTELEFYYPLRRFGAPQLAALLGKHAAVLPSGELPSAIESLDFRPVEGFMHGFIDCVFYHQDRYYLIDWKSNHLGDQPEDYAGPSLLREMVERRYFLQYYLYCVALDRYLASRMAEYDYETHFGGVYYVFLRGVVDTETASGIFHDRPTAGLVADLRKLLIG